MLLVLVRCVRYGAHFFPPAQIVGPVTITLLPGASVPGRLALVRAVKWVDEVIPDTPYCMTPEFLDTLFTQHRIDYVVHGDDPCLLPDGTDAYASAKAAGKYREFKRTEGVSSTDILGACCGPLKLRKAFGNLASGALVTPNSNHMYGSLACFRESSMCEFLVWFSVRRARSRHRAAGT